MTGQDTGPENLSAGQSTTKSGGNLERDDRVPHRNYRIALLALTVRFGPVEGSKGHVMHPPQLQLRKESTENCARGHKIWKQDEPTRSTAFGIRE